MKLLKTDSKGNIITGTTVILITSIILLLVFVITSIQYLENKNIEIKSSNNFKYIVEDYNKNIEVELHDSIKEVSEKVIKTKFPIHDSEKEIKKILNKKLAEKSKKYYKNYGIKINSQIISIENTDDPSLILCKVNINAKKDSESYTSTVTKQTSIEGFKDPLPFIKCGKSLSFFHAGNKIYYGLSLKEYLDLHGAVKISDGYIGASSPLTIKKCPFDPYTHHGDGQTLKKCIDSGYFHESADGSCYLCRLEGKGKCPHYGFEVFIKTIPNPDIELSISASDHVIFNDRYPGLFLDYFPGERLFLDSSHRLKYGLI